MLSPGAYMLLSVAADNLGNKEKSEWAKAVAGFLIRCLLKTDDGSEENLFVVMRVSDEYDIFMALEKEFQKQCLVFNQKTGCVLDRLIGTDCSEVYFDITVPYKRMCEQEARKKGNTSQ